MSLASPLWGAPRIHGELLKLGIEVSQTTVAKYLVRERKPPSQTWRTFLENHAKEIIATDFFTVPTATFRVLFVLVVLSHDRREILSRQVEAIGLSEILTAPASPWQNAYAERAIGTIRRECQDHAFILGEQHLRRTIKRFVGYYNGVRTHLSLEKDAPKRRPIQFLGSGTIRSRRHCGGLHHEYYRQAA